MMGGGVSETFKRFRHSRGYGVHSPFAYRLVMNVVHPGSLYEYYGYFDIDATLASADCRSCVAWRMRADARLLLRLAATLRPKKVFVDPELHTVYTTALHAADSRMALTGDPAQAEDCDLIVASAPTTPLPLLEKGVDRGTAVVLYDTDGKTSERLFSQLGEGLMLHSPDRAVIIPRPGMARVEYSVNL